MPVIPTVTNLHDPELNC